MKASTGVACGLAIVTVAGLVAVVAIRGDGAREPAGAADTAVATSPAPGTSAATAPTTTVPPRITVPTSCPGQTPTTQPAMPATAPVVTDTLGPGEVLPAPTFDAAEVEAAVRADPHVVEAIGSDFTVMSAVGVPGGVIAVTVKTGMPVVVPRTPYTWKWAVDEYGAPILDCGDPSVRPPLQYFRLTVLSPDFRLREIIPVLGETVEPGVAPTRPPPSMPPPVTLVSPEQVAAAEAALRVDTTITDVIGTDFTVIRAMPMTTAGEPIRGIGLELKLAGPHTLPAGTPGILGHGEGEPSEIGPIPHPMNGIRYVVVMLHTDHSLWYYLPMPDEFGERHEAEAG